MPGMTSAGLSAVIKANLVTRGWFAGDGVSQTAMQEFCDDLASAIVSYIQGNAIVLPTTLGVPTLFAPGGGGGPVTGTGTVT